MSTIHHAYHPPTTLYMTGSEILFGASIAALGLTPVGHSARRHRVPQTWGVHPCSNENHHDGRNVHVELTFSKMISNVNVTLQIRGTGYE